MQGNRSTETKPELKLRKALWSAGLRGYRLNWPSVPGRPDIAFVRWRLAVFVHGCFWHRCPHCSLPAPRTNSDYWQRKFSRNLERDQRRTQELRDAGWNVLRVWECEIERSVQECVEAVKAFLPDKRRYSGPEVSAFSD
jgi:DNA mismatch endonuclease (patch repair protein)